MDNVTRVYQTSDGTGFVWGKSRYEGFPDVAELPLPVRKQIARLEAVLGAPLPANYTHRPKGGFAATPGGLRQKRAQAALPGERWVGSNQV